MWCVSLHEAGENSLARSITKYIYIYNCLSFQSSSHQMPGLFLNKGDLFPGMRNISRRLHVTSALPAVIRSGPSSIVPVLYVPPFRMNQIC